jgi:hypothetical protein
MAVGAEALQAHQAVADAVETLVDKGVSGRDI